MGKFGKNRIPKFMKGQPVPESHSGRTVSPEIVSISDHGDNHAMIIIKTAGGEELELQFDYDGEGMLIAQHGDHEYSIPVEVEVVSDIEESKKAKPDYLDFDGDGDKKESMKKALKDKRSLKNAKGHKTAKTFESFINECWSPVKEGYNPAMSEEAKRAVKTICEDLLIYEARSCNEDSDPNHTYESYLNEVGSFLTDCMMESAASIDLDKE